MNGASAQPIPLLRRRTSPLQLVAPALTPAFSPFLYRYRNLVERFFNKLKHCRAIATRFEKHDANYLALVKLASVRIWLRFMSQ